MSRCNRKPAPRLATICAAILSGFALHAYAADSTATGAPAAASSRTSATFSVSAGPTADVLRAIAQQSGVKLNIDPDAVAHHQSPAINGAMSVQQAILRAIDGTGLTLAEQADGSLTVAKIQTLDVVHVYAQRDKAETRFKADRSDTATRSGADLHEIPQSVTIITSKVLETQQTRTIIDALQNVSGLSFSQSPQGDPAFRIRAQSASVMSNGLLDSNAAQGDTFVAERVEVLKGPQAILSGGNSLGGGVNIVTKKPQSETLRSVQLQYGSFGDKVLSADVTGMVAEDKRLSYRVIGTMAAASSSEANYDGRRLHGITTQLRWKDSMTDLIVGASFNSSHQPLPRVTFAPGNKILPVPAIKLASDEDGFKSGNHKLFYQLEQRFTPDVSLISRLQYASDKLEINARPSFFFEKDNANPDAILVNFSGSRTVRREKTLSGDHYLRLDLETGDFGHKVSLGVNHSTDDYRQLQYYGPDLTVQVFPAVPVSFQPTVSQVVTPSLDGLFPTKQIGVYVQDLINWKDWNLLLNLRRSKFDSGPNTLDFFDGNPFIDPKLTQYKTSPGAGIIYNFTPSTSFYASYQQGFQPQNVLSCQNTQLPPVESNAKELGAKFSLNNNKFAITTALFHHRLKNIAEYDPGNQCSTLRLGEISKGVELDMQGELFNGFSTILNYTYSKIRDPGDDTALFAGEPRQKLSFWATYSFKRHGLPGWGAGLGVTAQSRSEGSVRLPSRFTIPGQSAWDVSAFYDNAEWSATFGVKNIFDRLQYGVSRSPLYVPVKEGRTFAVSLKRTFK